MELNSHLVSQSNAILKQDKFKMSDPEFNPTKYFIDNVISNSSKEQLKVLMTLLSRLISFIKEKYEELIEKENQIEEITTQLIDNNIERFQDVIYLPQIYGVSLSLYGIKYIT